MGKAFPFDAWAEFILPAWPLTSSNNSWKSRSLKHEIQCRLNFGSYCQHRQCVKSVVTKQEMNLSHFTIAGNVANDRPVITEDVVRHSLYHGPLGIVPIAFLTSEDHISLCTCLNSPSHRKCMPNSIRGICADLLTHLQTLCDTL